VRPYNAEPLLGPLRAAGAITPVSLFFKRNHGPLPVLEDPGQFEVMFDGVGFEAPVSLSLEGIKGYYASHTVAALICCAGNRRSEMDLALCPAPPADVGMVQV